MNDYKGLLLIIIQGMMKVGGIETYYYRLIKHASEKGAIVFLYMNRNGIIDSVYSDLATYRNVYIKRGRMSHQDIMNTIKQESIKNIKLLSCTLYDFSLGDIEKRYLTSYPVDNFFMIPHFVGDTIFLEDSYEGETKEKIKKRTSDIIKKLVSNRNIRFFNNVHRLEISKRYGIEDKIIFPDWVPITQNSCKIFDEQRCIRLYNREKFNILTISRFEFPHKGYIIGLIKTFVRLKKKYPSLVLTIVGYGPGSLELEKEIISIDANIRKDIHLIGKTPPEKLVDYYNDANVNIGVAGCYSMGVANGTLSIPARHYSYECEVYGLSPESNDYSLSSLSGEPLEKYIEIVMNMSESQYIEACRQSFLSKNGQNGQLGRDKINEIVNIMNNPVLSYKDICFIHWETLKRKIKFHINNRK